MKLLIGLLALPLLAQQQRSVNFFSIEKERALGEALAKDVRQRSHPLGIAAVDAYVKRVGTDLVAHLAERQFPYTFEVIDDANTAEPIALPGGQVFVPARFLLAVEHEAEFATMLAHVIAHAALRHGTRSATREQIVNQASIPLVNMGGWSGSHASVNQAARVLIPVGLMQFQRRMELEADRFGLELAEKAGYNGAAFRKYVQRVQKDTPNPTYSPLPTREARLAAMDEVLSGRPAGTGASSAEFVSAQSAVRETLKAAEPKAPSLLR